LGDFERFLKGGIDVARVLCVGILVADLIGRPIENFPEKGKLLLVDEMSLHVGGCAHNTGVDLHKLGEEVQIIGKVGRDGLGEFIINSLRRRGMDTSGILFTDQANTSATMVLLDSSGERTFLHYPGANRTLRSQDISDEMLAASQLVHVAGSFLMPGFDGEETALLLKRAKALGRTTSLDTAWDDTGSWFSLLEPVVPHLDILISNYDEASRISGKEELPDIGAFFLKFGIQVVAIKMGPQGSFIMTSQDKVLVPPFTVEAVDGTGAGDAFAAGFIFGYLRGWDWYQVGRFANACGAMCVQKMGATEGVGSFEEVAEFIRSNSAYLGGEVN